MKKFLKENIRLFLGVIIGILASSITAYAVNSYTSNQIRYQNNTFAINSVSEALDDLYSYSKEKIDNNTSNNYSTEEQVVGKWIDGKPLYQKTYLISKNSNARVTAPLNIINLEKIYNITGAIRDNNSNTIDIGYWNNENVWLNSTSIIIEENTSSLGDYYITIQYTKTIDTATS